MKRLTHKLSGKMVPVAKRDYYGNWTYEYEFQTCLELVEVEE